MSISMEGKGAWRDNVFVERLWRLQPTCSRLENLRDIRTVIQLGRVLVDLWLSCYAAPPKSVTLDVDERLDVVHGHQQLSLFNAHYERCFLSIHVYDAATGRPVAMILRPGKTPTGEEIGGYLRRLVRLSAPAGRPPVS